MISQNELHEYLNYDPETGIFTWKKASSNKTRIGDKAGCIRPDGYILIGFKKSFLAHRLAFLYMLNETPKFVDHINGNRSDNRWENLRSVSRSENGRNMKIPLTNKSGVIGVFWNAGKKKWTAKIKINQVSYHLGDFDNLNDASIARAKAEKQFLFHKNHGRFF